MKKRIIKTIVVSVVLIALIAALAACGEKTPDSDQVVSQIQQATYSNSAGSMPDYNAPEVSDIPQATYSNMDVSMPEYSAPDVSDLPEATYSNSAGNYDEEDEGNNTVYFDDPIGWGDTYVYYWSDSDKNMVKWPGDKMEEFEGVWRYTLPDDVDYIIFTNGALQTRDIPYNPAQTNYRLSSDRDADKSYYVEDWQGNIVDSSRVDPKGKLNKN